MVELWWLDWIGWIGFVGLGLFYWLLGSGNVLQAYIFGTIGAVAWLIVGIATQLGFASQLPSLIIMETMVILMNIRGIYNWRKEKPSPPTKI
jgi:nicotinamide riboside transporter PnuC